MLKPIDDESGFGLLCRASYLMGFRNLQALSDYLLPDLRELRLSGTQDGDLSLLAALSSLILGVSPDECITRFSNVPLYRPFTRQPVVLVSYEKATQEGALAWQMRRSIEPEHRFAWWKPLCANATKLRYCGQCAREQYESSGSTTWMRSHNVLDLSVCAIHGCELRTVRQNGISLPPLETDRSTRVRHFAPVKSLDVKRADYIKSLLALNLPWIPHSSRSRIFRRRLVDMDEAGAVDSNKELQGVTSMPAIQSYFLPHLRSMAMDTSSTVRLLMAMFDDVQVLANQYANAAAGLPNFDHSHWKVEAGTHLTLRAIAKLVP